MGKNFCVRSPSYICSGDPKLLLCHQEDAEQLICWISNFVLFVSIRETLFFCPGDTLIIHQEVRRGHQK